MKMLDPNPHLHSQHWIRLQKILTFCSSYCYCPGTIETGGHKLTSTRKPRPEITPLQPWTGQQRILEKPQPSPHSSNGALSSVTREESTDDLAAKRTREVCLTQESLLAAASRTKPSVSQTELQKYHTM